MEIQIFEKSGIQNTGIRGVQAMKYRYFRTPELEI